MQIFCENTLTELLLRCRENPEYRAIIVFNTRLRTREFFNEMCNLHQNESIDGVNHIMFDEFNQDVRIEFTNGSYIDAMECGSETLLGRTYHEGVIDENLMNPDVMLTVQSHINEYRFPTHGRRRRRPIIDLHEFNGSYYNAWIDTNLEPESRPETEFSVDKQSEEILDDFLNSFKITT